MADLIIWWGAGSVKDVDNDALNVLVLPGFGGSTAERIANPTTSTASGAAPDLGGAITPCNVKARGGEMWITGAATAAPSGANCIPILDGEWISFGVPRGQTIKAINHS